MITIYLVLSTAMFLFLASVWSYRKLVDKLMKFSFVCLSVAGIVLTLQAFGYIIKGN